MGLMQSHGPKRFANKMPFKHTMFIFGKIDEYVWSLADPELQEGGTKFLTKI